MEFLEFGFGKNVESTGSKLWVRFGGQILNRVNHLKYLGSVVQENEEIAKNVAGWSGLKWLKYYEQVSLNLKRKFYKHFQRPAMMCASKFWADKMKKKCSKN